jgi:glycosyltransferase involved in cell wall biosynthesis
MLPRRHHAKHIVADIFISIYDTVVNDRRLLRPNNPLARFLRLVEKRACTFADINIVDTEENAAWLYRELGLPDGKARPVTLSTDELHFRPSPYAPNEGVVRVLFVGTLVSLHGIDVIAEAATLLSKHSNIVFRLIGDGQEACHLEKAIRDSGAKNIAWVRAWESSEQIAQEIERADICLGIFGKTAKAQRVCPLKVYAYSAIGRPIITGQTEWLRRAVSALEHAPFAAVPVGNASALANKIIELANNPTLRLQLADDSRRFYETNLANQIANSQLMKCLIPIRA